jgi:hypothetical protein
MGDPPEVQFSPPGTLGFGDHLSLDGRNTPQMPTDVEIDTTLNRGRG